MTNQLLPALCLVWLTSSPALATPSKPNPVEDKADSPEAEKREAARRFFETGSLLFERGEFSDAAREFERAFREAPLPEFLYNVASAYDKAGERQKATLAYRRFASTMPASKDAVVAEKRAEVLERELKELEAARAPASKLRLPPKLPFVEPVTRFVYQTLIDVGGRPYTLLGAGARKVSLFKVYAMAMYVDDEPARSSFPRLAAQAGGSDHDTVTRGDLAQKWFILSDFGKHARLHFVRNVSAKDTRDSYRECLADSFASSAPAPVRANAAAFLALFDEDLKDGDDMIIATDADGQVAVEYHGKKRVGPKDLRLAHDIWDIWLGQKPVSADLKKSLLDRVDTFGR